MAKKNDWLPKTRAATSELDVAKGRFANMINVGVLKEEFVLDFLSRGMHEECHVARLFITVDHARRLRNLLTRQISEHRRRYKSDA